MAKGDEERKDGTGADLEVLRNLEKAFYRNNPNAQKRRTEKSLKWFSRYIPKSMNNARTSQLMRDRSMWKKSITPGRMTFFQYDPIHKATLPVYDRFPLVFAWDVWKGGNGKFGYAGKTYFIGINLHYLPPKLRFVVMKALLTLRTNKKSSYRKNSTLGRLSWAALQRMSESKYFEHSVKIYRMDHVKTTFIEIPSQSWEIAAFLPVARFEKGGKSEAWKIK